MPNAREFKCRIHEVLWVTPTVMQIRFYPDKKFKFAPGQFLSVLVPREKGDSIKRAYSFSSAPHLTEKDGYELCVKHVKGGIGTEYLASLKPGDSFKAFAPYGDFEYRVHAGDRSVVFISTGTGIAPFKGIAMSRIFAENPPAQSLCLFGAPKLNEILYPGIFESCNVKRVNAIDAEPGAHEHFKGRVTDYIRAKMTEWPWHSTDFYLCGNPLMVSEVTGLLKGGHGVADEAIHRESFSAPTVRAPAGKPMETAKPAPMPDNVRSIVPPPPPSAALLAAAARKKAVA